VCLEILVGAGAMKRANTQDLALLKSILEAEPRR
jgi:hypothetical protein